jgi:hypothetical protein
MSPRQWWLLTVGLLIKDGGVLNASPLSSVTEDFYEGEAYR